MTDLSAFEGHEVRASKLALSAADTPLSAALEVDPVELRLGQTVQLVLEATVTEIKHKPMKEGDDLVRVHALKTSRAAIVPGDSPVAAGTLGLLNDMTERLADAGVSPGAIPGQTVMTPGAESDADGDQAVADAIEADDQWDDDNEPVRSGSS